MILFTGVFFLASCLAERELLSGAAGIPAGRFYFLSR